MRTVFFATAALATFAMIAMVSTFAGAPVPARRELEDTSAAIARLTQQVGRLAEQAASTQKQVGRFAQQAESIHSAHQAEMKALRRDVTVQLNMLRLDSARAAAPPTVVARTEVAIEPPKPKDVQVTFIFDVSEHLGKAIDIFWLFSNATERLYSSLPAGQRVVETTLPGMCWRARSQQSSLFKGHGQHLLTYCATNEPTQFVNIVPQTNVSVQVHFPRSRKLVSKAEVYTVRSVGGVPVEQPAGEVAQGGDLQLATSAGTVLRARDPLTRQLLFEGVVGYEAEQLVDITGSSVSLELSLAPSSAPGERVDVFWTWGEGGDGSGHAFAREHFHAQLTSPGQTLRIPSAAGEEWIVRRATDLTERLLAVTLTEAPTQQHVVVVPPKRA